MNQYYKKNGYSKPNTIKLGKYNGPVWDQLGTLRQDKCTRVVEDKESKEPGDYQLSGYDPSYQYVDDYSNRLDNAGHFQKVYRGDYAYVNDESKLFFSILTNPRCHNQLFTRPYAGFFSGPGMPSIEKKDLESALQQGLLTNLRQKPCESCRGESAFKWSCLPEFGNPQNIIHIEPPTPRQGGYYRNGYNTRDIARRIDFDRRCANQMNSQTINK